MRKQIKNLLGCVGVSLLLCGLGYAQQSDSTPPAQGASSDAAVTSTSTPTVTADSDDGGFRILGAAGYLRDQVGLYRRGSFRLNSVSMNETVLNSSYSSDVSSISTFSANFSFEHRLGRRSQMALQYAPEFWVVDGTTGNNLGNQTASVDYAVGLSQRMLLTINDAFSNFNMRSMADVAGLAFDPQSGALYRSNFLDQTGRSISNTTTATFRYLVSARTTLSVSPNYTWSHVSAASSTSAQQSYGYNFGTGSSYGVNVDLNYRLSAMRSIGTYYSMRQSTWGDRRVFHSAGLTYGQSFGPNWTARATLGGSMGQQPTVEGSATITRKFARASMALMYTRSNEIGELFYNGYTDRADLTYTRQIVRRLTGSAGMSYYRQSWGIQPTTGKYAHASLAYPIMPSVNWMVSYAYNQQNGNTPLLLSGHRNMFMVSLIWSPLTRGR